MAELTSFVHKEHMTTSASGPKRFMSQVITITGSTGVGKTSTLASLRLLLPTYRFFGGGEYMRAEAKKLGMTIEEFARYCKKHPEHDMACDLWLQQMGRLNNTVIDTRVPKPFNHAFRVLLTCSIELCAHRRRHDIGYQHLTFQAVINAISERDLANLYRYERLYPNQALLELDYDCVLSTEKMAPMNIAQEIRTRHAGWSQEMHSQGRLVDSFEAL